MDTQNVLPIQYIHHETWDYAPLFSNDINGKPNKTKIEFKLVFQDYFLSKPKVALDLNIREDHHNNF